MKRTLFKTVKMVRTKFTKKEEIILKRTKMKVREYTDKRTYTEQSLVLALYRDISAYNNQWTMQVLQTFSMQRLVCQAHPSYRNEYEEWAVKLGMRWDTALDIQQKLKQYVYN